MNELVEFVSKSLLVVVLLFLIILILGLASLMVAMFFKAHQTLKEKKDGRLHD